MNYKEYLIYKKTKELRKNRVGLKKTNKSFMKDYKRC